MGGASEEPADPVGPKGDRTDIQDAFRNLSDAADRKYADAQAEMERIDKAMGLIEEAAGILAG